MMRFCGGGFVGKNAAYLVPLADMVSLAVLEEALVVWDLIFAVDESAERVGLAGRLMNCMNSLDMCPSLSRCRARIGDYFRWLRWEVIVRWAFL